MAKQILQRRDDFEKWLQQCVVTVSLDVPESTVKKALACIGINSFNVFEESDELKIRLYVSELVMKCEKVKLDNPSDYLSVVNRLLCYAEYLGCKDKNVKPIKRNDGMSKKKELITNVEGTTISILEERDKLQDTLIVAYYLSRINMEAVKELGYESFRAAFDGLAALLGQKPATIKNMRDEFDPYFENGRAGWYQRSMSPSRKAVFDKMANVSDEELKAIVKKIVLSYFPEDRAVEEGVSMHKKIKISSGDMKEIKTRKK